MKSRFELILATEHATLFFVIIQLLEFRRHELTVLSCACGSEHRNPEKSAEILGYITCDSPGKPSTCAGTAERNLSVRVSLNFLRCVSSLLLLSIVHEDGSMILPFPITSSRHHIFAARTSSIFVLLTAFVSSCVAMNFNAKPINKYTGFDTFGSVVVRCPIDTVWEAVGKGEQWSRALLGDRLINTTTLSGDDRTLGSRTLTFVKTLAGDEGFTQSRLLELSDYNYQRISTSENSSLPLGPWTTQVTLNRVTYIDGEVEFTLINSAAFGSINVPDEQRETTRARFQSFFGIVFAPALKEKFDDCGENMSKLDAEN